MVKKVNDVSDGGVDAAVALSLDDMCEQVAKQHEEEAAHRAELQAKLKARKMQLQRERYQQPAKQYFGHAQQILFASDNRSRPAVARNHQHNAQPRRSGGRVR